MHASCLLALLGMLVGREQRTTNNGGMIEKELLMLMLMGMAIPLLLFLSLQRTDGHTHPSSLDSSTYFPSLIPFHDYLTSPKRFR